MAFDPDATDKNLLLDQTCDQIQQIVVNARKQLRTSYVQVVGLVLSNSNGLTKEEINAKLDERAKKGNFMSSSDLSTFGAVAKGSLNVTKAKTIDDPLPEAAVTLPV